MVNRAKVEESQLLKYNYRQMDEQMDMQCYWKYSLGPFWFGLMNIESLISLLLYSLVQKIHHYYAH